jgi:uncharacterized protein (TIGR02001 family)
MRNIGLKSLMGAGVLAFALSGQALAADMPVKAAPAAPVAPDFDIAFGGGIMSDYIFRGITQSNHGPSATAYFEPHYKEFYIGVAGSGIDWPADAAHQLNSPSAEVDLYGGWRPVIGKWSFDLGYIWYAYPKTAAGTFKSDFGEVYGKVSYALTDALSIGGAVYYSPDVLNYHLNSTYYEANAKYVVPSSYFAKDWGAYVSGAYGHWHIEQTAGSAVPSYDTWNAGIGFTYKALTLDLRYSDTDLSHNGCVNFWIGGPAVGGWCRAAFAAKLSFDLLASNLK